MEESLLNSLRQDIRLNIFSRLPAELVLDCKQVCRAWRNLIRLHVKSAYFAHAHQHLEQQLQADGSDSAPISFVFWDGDTYEGSQEIHYAEYHEDEEVISDKQPNLTTKRLNINFDFLKDKVCEIVGSCNGLICLSSIRKKVPDYGLFRDTRHGEDLYICNPITREIVNVPGLSIDAWKYEGVKEVRIAQGFGYHPLTNGYKVIRIWYIVDKYKSASNSKGQVEVYTLGSGKAWRHIGETSYKLCWIYCDSRTSSGVWFDGAIHWPHKGYQGVVAFDLLCESFEFLPISTGRLTQPDMASLGVMRGSLCYFPAQAFICEPLSWELDMWFLKNKNKEEQPYLKKSWNMSKITTSYASIPAVTRLGDIFLLVAHWGVISRYDIETTTWKEMWQSKYKNNHVVPILHINSFISLKALGESNTKIIKESADGDDMQRRSKEI